MSAAPRTAGVKVAITRPRIGRLGELLQAAGAVVVHAPLIAIEPVTADRLLDDLGSYDWLVVTSIPGAEQAGAAASLHPDVKLAAVGSATASELGRRAGREVDLVPDRQLGSELGRLLGDVAGAEPSRILVAQGDRAGDAVSNALEGAGHHVDTMVVYRTVEIEPDLATISACDAMILTSGSAATSWARAVERADDHPGALVRWTPEIVVSIGPTTTQVAEAAGLKIAATSADHSLDGVVTALVDVVRDRRRDAPPG